MGATMMHGFEVKSVEELPDLSAKFWRMEYAKNGAELVWIDCEDENRAFEIAFRTIPEDDCGVAHILEHAVLCGSEKYPSREPFVEMLKSSPHTYLNAYTAKDMTGYPVASRNEKDFLNLTSVYLDAVFHPLTVKSDWSMRQEGWHYEYDGETLTRNGIVYSEMKGAMGSPHTQMYHDILALLFPNTVYRFNSGGLPSAIPSLTFEKYQAFHARHYHPSNARIFLYGKIDLDKTLELIASELKDFDRRDEEIVIPLQQPVKASRTVRYASKEVKNKTLSCTGWVVGSYNDVERLAAIDILCELLAGSNFSPLKEPLLKSGLCEDIGVGLIREQQPVLLLNYQNIKDGEVEACREFAYSILSRLVNEGLDQDRIAQLIDKHEFAWRERDTSDRGIGLAREVYQSWNYGGDPALNLRGSNVYASLRKRLNTNWWARLLLDSTMWNPHRAELTMVPSATLADEEAAADAEELKKIKESLSESELSAIAEAAADLKRRHAAPEDPAVVAKLPRLTLEDMPEDCEILGRTIEAVDGVTVIRPHQELPGFFYLDLCFSLNALTKEELLDTALLTDLLGELGAAGYSVETLKGKMDGTLGSFTADVASYEKGPHMIVRVAALDSHREEALTLVRDILLKTDFSDVEAIETKRNQCRVWLETAARGRSAFDYSVRRAASSLSAVEGMNELLKGVDQLRHLQTGKAGDLAVLAKKIFTRDNLTIALAGDTPAAFPSEIVAAFPATDSAVCTSAVISGGVPKHAPFEGFTIDGSVAYAALATKLPSDVEYSGAQLVAAKIISLEYLWPELRVKGGAYGAFFSLGANRTLSFRSYRDPNPAKAYEVYTKAGDKLRAFVASGASFEKYQVSSLELTDPNFSPREKMAYVRSQYFNGRDVELPRKLRREIIHTSREDLLAFADALDRAVPVGAKCVVGSEELVRACGPDDVCDIIETK